MNISQKTIDALKEMYTISLWKREGGLLTEVEGSKEANEMCIGFSFSDALYIGKTIKATKKELTLEAILDKINSNTSKEVKKFSKEFKKIINKEFKGIDIYPTEYGIGIFVAIGFRDDIEAKIKAVEDKLNYFNIDFKNETSECGWVYRFKISKSAKNIEKLKNVA